MTKSMKKTQKEFAHGLKGTKTHKFPDKVETATVSLKQQEESTQYWKLKKNGLAEA